MTTLQELELRKEIAELRREVASLRLELAQSQQHGFYYPLYPMPYIQPVQPYTPYPFPYVTCGGASGNLGTSGNYQIT